MMNVTAAHRFCRNNRSSLRASDACGCFHCCTPFPADEVTEWTDLDDGEPTALCPRCGIDAVIGSATGAPVTPEFLRRMHDHWFAASEPDPDPGADRSPAIGRDGPGTSTRGLDDGDRRRSAMSLVTVGDARLEVLDEGSGEPVVCIQTALTADELLPLADRLRDRFRTIVYHRRGYAGSSPTAGPGSIQRDAADCRALLDALRIPRAHLVGVSYSGAVAIQLAADTTKRVHSLTVVEPPPVHVASADEFRAANERLLAARPARGPDAAVEEFLTLVVGPHWRTDMERNVPGSVEQTRRDAATFFDADLPALLAWKFSAGDAARVTCPVLHVGGSASGPWFAEVRELILGWFPHAQDVVVDGADHSLAITHTDQVAAAVDSFLRHHPMR